MRGKTQRDSPVRDRTALYTLRPIGTLWLVGYWLDLYSAMPVKMEVSMAWFDLIFNMLPKFFALLF